MNSDSPCASARCFVLTAGGTREPLDAVRHISNVASGSLPAAIANELLCRGATVYYIHGPEARLPGHVSVQLELMHDTAKLHEMLSLLNQRVLTLAAEVAGGHLHLLPIVRAVEAAEVLKTIVGQVHPEAVACAMAVADWAPIFHAGKIASQLLGTESELAIHLQPTPKAIDGVKAAWPATRLLGFKLLADASEADLLSAATRLLERSGADAVFANDMREYRQGIRQGLLISALPDHISRLHGGVGETGLQKLAFHLANWLMPPAQQDCGR